LTIIRCDKCLLRQPILTVSIKTIRSGVKLLVDLLVEDKAGAWLSSSLSGHFKARLIRPYSGAIKQSFGQHPLSVTRGSRPPYQAH